MTKQVSFNRFAGMFAAGAAAIALLAAPAAQAVDFSGKRMRVIVPFNEGGGTDSFTRFMQPYWEKYLPGKPKILVINKPGAGGIVGGNYFEQRAKTDGTWMMALSTSTIMNFVLKDPRVKFDIKGWNPVMLAPRGNMIYVRPELGVHDIKDKKGQVEHLKKCAPDCLVFGGKTPTSSAINKRMSLSFLGLEVKDVWGMKGNGPMALAFERGEFTINFDNSLSYKNNRKELRKRGLAKEWFTLGAPDAQGNWGTDPVWPNVQTYYDVYKAIHGKEPSGPEGEALNALVQLGVGANKSFHLPKGTKKEVVDTWIAATKKAMADPDFLKKREKILGPYQVATGDAAKKLIHARLELSPKAKSFIKKYVKDRYNIELAL